MSEARVLLEGNGLMFSAVVLLDMNVSRSDMCASQSVYLSTTVKLQTRRERQRDKSKWHFRGTTGKAEQASANSRKISFKVYEFKGASRATCAAAS